MKSTLPWLAAYRFFGEFAPIVPFAAVFFADLGLSLAQISWLFFVWAGSVVVFEVPTGLLADRISKKTILILARLAKLSCFALWLVHPTFAGFLVGYILWGLGTALDSGAFQGFLYEKVRSLGAVNDFARIYGKITTASFLGLFLSAALGGFLIPHGFAVLIGVSVVSLGLSLLLILLVPRLATETETPSEQFSLKVLAQDVRYLFTHPVLLAAVTVGIAAGGIKGSLEEYQSLFLENKGITLALIGLFIASLEIIKAFGSYLAGYFSGSVKFQAVYLGLIGGCFILAALVPSFFTLIFLALVIFIDVVLWVHNDTTIQHTATDANRVTLASFKNFSIELCAVALFGVVGVFGSSISTPALYLAGGMLLLLVSLTMLGALFSKKQRTG